MSHDYAIQKLNQQTFSMGLQIDSLEKENKALRNELRELQKVVQRQREELEAKLEGKSDRHELNMGHVLDYISVHQEASLDALRAWVRAHVRDAIEAAAAEAAEKAARELDRAVDGAVDEAVGGLLDGVEDEVQATDR